MARRAGCRSRSRPACPSRPQSRSQRNAPSADAPGSRCAERAARRARRRWPGRAPRCSATYALGRRVGRPRRVERAAEVRDRSRPVVVGPLLDLDQLRHRRPRVERLLVRAHGRARLGPAQRRLVVAQPQLHRLGGGRRARARPSRATRGGRRSARRRRSGPCRPGWRARRRRSPRRRRRTRVSASGQSQKCDSSGCVRDARRRVELVDERGRREARQPTEAHQRLVGLEPGRQARLAPDGDGLDRARGRPRGAAPSTRWKNSNAHAAAAQRLVERGEDDVAHARRHLPEDRAAVLEEHLRGQEDRDARRSPRAAIARRPPSAKTRS